MGVSLSEYGPRSRESVLRRGLECRIENMQLRGDSILGADAHHRRIETIKHPLLYRGSDLTRKAAEMDAMAGYNAPAGLLHRAQDGFHIQWNQGSQIDHFGADAGFGLKLVRRYERFVDHRSPGDQSDVVSRTLDFRRSQRDEILLFRHTPLESVQQLSLDEHDGVVIRN